MNLSTKNDMDAGIKNIEEVRIFGQNLNVASNNLITLFQQLTQQMYRVQESWQDNQNAKFMQEFEQRQKEIIGIAEQMQLYSQYINKACDIAEQYKNLRF